jgi:hypothetical protein
MIGRTVIGAAAALVLAGCGSNEAQKAADADGVTLKNVSIAEARNEAQQTMKLQPGQWDVAVNMTKVEIPGAPPEVAQALGGAMAKQARTFSHCLTPAEANRPPADVIGGESNGQCRYDNFSMAGGRMNATMICNAADGNQTRMTLTGTYTATSYDMGMDMRMSGAGVPGGKGMNVQARTTGKRTGACA